MFDLLLISPENTQLGYFKRFVPRSVPVGIGILAGYFRKHGISAKILDQEIVNITPSTLQSYLSQCKKPRIVGISVMTANVASGYKMAALIKSIDKETKVVFGGIHATVMPDEILKHGDIDFVVKGEGEYSFLELIKQIKGDRIEPDKLKNIGFVDAGQIVYTQDSSQMVDVDNTPMFPYDMFNSSQYNLGFILTSRGCPFDCIFCSQRVITKRKYRYSSSEKVIEELAYLINDLHQPNITFFDDFFTGNKKRVIELCEMIKERGFHKKASFGIQTRADSLDRELLQAMKDANVASLMFGVETASEKLMTLIQKRETVEQNVEAINLAKEMGFVVEATFIFGFPGETLEDRLDALAMSINTKVDRARFNNATPYPGTALYEMTKDDIVASPQWINFNSVNAVTASVRNRLPLPYVPKGSTPQELEGTVLFANLLFYLNSTNLKKLFNLDQKGSGKWFEVSKKDLFSPLVILDLLKLAASITTRSIIYLVKTNKCRQFFITGLKM